MRLVGTVLPMSSPHCQIDILAEQGSDFHSLLVGLRAHFSLEFHRLILIRRVPYKLVKVENVRARFRAESGFLDYDGVAMDT
jgi:hypothetical protein